MSHHILINPRWPQEQIDYFQNLSHEIIFQYKMKDVYVFTSSGTTSVSYQQTKLIFHSVKTLKQSAQTVVDYFGINQGSIWGQVLPEFHVGGVGVRLRAEITKSPVVNLLNEQLRWDPEYFYENLKKNSVTHVSLVPTQLYDLLNKKYQAPPSLQIVFIGGGAVDRVLLEKAQRLKWPLVLTFGMTETASMIAVSDKLGPDTNLNEFRGFNPLPHTQFKLEDDILHLKCQSLMLASVQRDEKLNLKIIFLPEDSWFQTEDHCQINTNNKYEFLGRSKDFIKISGESVNLFNLKNQFLSLDKILPHPDKYTSDEFYLTAMKDERTEYKIVLFTTSHQLDFLKKCVSLFNSSVRPYEKIRTVYKVSHIPKNALMKVVDAQLSFLEREILNI